MPTLGGVATAEPTTVLPLHATQPPSPPSGETMLVRVHLLRPFALSMSLADCVCVND